MAKVFLIGNHRPSLALARGLRRAGHEVWVGMNGYCDYVNWSRAVSGQLDIPDFEAEAACIAVIEDHLKIHAFDALIPVTDRATRMVADHRERLERCAAIVSPDPDIVATCVSKTRMAEICKEERIGLAPMRQAGSLDGVRAAADEIGYPLVVKPTGEGAFIFDRKVIAARNALELENGLPRWPAGHAALLVQRRLDGHRMNHYFVAREGRLLTACAVEILRTDRRDGSGYAVEGRTVTPAASLREQTERLVRRLNYTGAGCAQYMTAAEGEATSFLEINPRLGANFIAAEAAGAGMSERALRLAMGGRPKAPRNPWERSRTGVRYAWTKGDVSGLLWERKTGLSKAQIARWIGRMAMAGLSAHTHLTFSWRDPAPALGCWLHPLIKRVGRRKDAARRVKTAA